MTVKLKYKIKTYYLVEIMDSEVSIKYSDHANAVTAAILLSRANHNGIAAVVALNKNTVKAPGITHMHRTYYLNGQVVLPENRAATK